MPQGRKETKKKNTHGLLRKCQPPARQRFPGGIGWQERQRAVPGQEDGNERGEVREDTTTSKEKEIKTVLSFEAKQKKKQERYGDSERDTTSGARGAM